MSTAQLRRRACALLVLPVATGLALVPSSGAWAAPGDTIRVSVVPAYGESTGYASLPVLSSLGQHVLFSSDAPELWRDPNGQPTVGVGAQLYLSWLESGSLTPVTVNTGNRPSEGGLLGQHDVSAMHPLPENGDGEFIGVVVFDSTASDLTRDADTERCTDQDGESFNCSDVFVRDVYDGQTHKISMNADTGEEADGRSVHPRVSDDGKWVVFASEASNLVPGDTVGSWDIFLAHLPTGSLRRLTNGEPGVAVGEPAISADGSTVAFWSTATTLDPAAPSGAGIYVWNRFTGLHALPASGRPGFTFSPTLSGDGRLVGFMSYDQLLPEDLNPSYDLYLRDRVTGRTSLANVGPGGTRAVNADRLEIADDGGHVLFRGGAGLVPGTPTGRSYVYVRDLATGAIRIANVNDAGELSDGGADTGWRSLSPDGSRAVFSSRAGNLVAGDTNGTDDVFLTTLRDWVPPAPPLPPGALDAPLDGSGGQLVTGTEATAAVPVVAAITPPPGLTGQLTVTPAASDPAQAPAGYDFFGRQLVIDGPPATVAAPYVMSFTVDASLLGGIAPADVQVFRNGVAVADCTDPSAAVPDPCVAGRTATADGDAVLAVRTSAFSAWAFGRLDYDTAGPLGPVHQLPAVNTVKAGSAVPVSFTLGGDRGLDVLATGFPQMSSCTGTASAGEATSSPGGSTLGYDEVTGTYTYVWKTPKNASGCREFVLRLRDGSEVTARFELR